MTDIDLRAGWSLLREVTIPIATIGAGTVGPLPLL